MKSNEKKRVNLTDIAEALDSPSAFTAKILQKLVKGEIIESVKGPHGGFQISQEKIDTVTLLDVVTTVDGTKIFTGCGLGLAECNANNPCPLHEHFVAVRGGLKHMLENTSLQKLAEQLENGTAVLKI